MMEPGEIAMGALAMRYLWVSEGKDTAALADAENDRALRREFRNARVPDVDRAEQIAAALNAEGFRCEGKRWTGESVRRLIKRTKALFS